MDQSWSYREASNIGYWTWGSTDRFKYDYGAQQWWDTSTFSGWQKLGAAGQSLANHSGVSDPNFLGNGVWHTVGTGLSYMGSNPFISTKDLKHLAGCPFSEHPVFGSQLTIANRFLYQRCGVYLGVLSFLGGPSQSQQFPGFGSRSHSPWFCQRNVR